MKAKRAADGGVIVKMETEEAEALASWVEQVDDLVAPGALSSDDPLAEMVGIDTNPERPEDPAVRRLFPDAYVNDAQASTEFRRYTEHELRQRKHQHCLTTVAGLGTVAESGTVRLSADEARAWLGTLNDLRLVLGTRLDVQEDEAWEDENDPRGPMLLVYQWLTYVQGTLVEATRPRHP